MEVNLGRRWQKGLRFIIFTDNDMKDSENFSDVLIENAVNSSAICRCTIIAHLLDIVRHVHSNEDLTLLSPKLSFRLHAITAVSPYKMNNY